MAIDFEQKENNSNLTKYLVIGGIVIIVLIIVFVVLGGKNEEKPVTFVPLFSPINIDFSFISSQEFAELEEFDGIPVLPGFFEASDEIIEEEKIEYGRNNPFAYVSSTEIETAVIKVIQKIETLEKLEEMSSLIESSTLYSSDQKQNLFKSIEEQKEIIEAKMEEENTPIEIIIEQEQGEEEENGGMEIFLEEETIEETNPENGSSDNFKEW